MAGWGEELFDWIVVDGVLVDERSIRKLSPEVLPLLVGVRSDPKHSRALRQLFFVADRLLGVGGRIGSEDHVNVEDLLERVRLFAGKREVDAALEFRVLGRQVKGV